MVKQKTEAIRTSISFINKELLDAAQGRSKQLYLGNLSMYLQQLIIKDLQEMGIDISKILKL